MYQHILGCAHPGLIGPIVGLVMVISAGAIAQETTTAPDNKRVAYVEHACYQCHGYEGQGGGFGGPRIAPDPLPYETFAEVVRRPYGVMPAYSIKVLSDEELKLIYGFVISIPEPPEAEEIRSFRDD